MEINRFPLYDKVRVDVGPDRNEKAAFRSRLRVIRYKPLTVFQGFSFFEGRLTPLAEFERDRE
jgi:hypothetical protein